MINQNLLLAGDDGYNLTKSLRFRASASTYLSRTFGTPTNANLWTFSVWLKRSNLGAFGTIIGNLNTTYPIYQFLTTNAFGVYDSGSSSTTVVYRDPSAWYHLVIQRTSSTAVSIYFNGVLTNSFTGQTNTFNTSGSTYTIGRSQSGEYFDGYMTEVNFVDGQSLTPSSFGAFSSTTGVWQPAKYTGTYGTNGFYLPFTNTTSTSTLGNDFSGNSNTWTVNNFSLTAGTTYDSMNDVPTLTSATAANYCVLNPLDYESSTFTLSNANLTFAGARTASGSYYTRSTVAVTSGKWYWEVTPTDVGAGPNLAIGIQSLPSALTGGGSLMLNGYGYSADGNKYNNAGSSAYGASWTNGDVIGIAYDATAGTITFYKNNTSQGTAFTGITAGTYTPVIEMSTGGVARTVAGSINFGQRPFAYTPPTGYVALNTFNLPTSTIVKGNTVMDVSLYTGNGTGQTITNSGLMKPDLVWIKSRSAAYNHGLIDTNRGINKHLFSNMTNAEATCTAGKGITAITSTGFTLGTESDTSAPTNENGTTFVGWQWQAGQGTNTSNTNGSITSTVSANPTAGFSIVTYTGTGSNATVGHGLGVAPKMIIVKIRNSSVYSWAVGNTSIGWANYLLLNTTDATASSSTVWQSTAPTSSVFSIGTSSAVNLSSGTFVAYCFAQIAGYSAFGSYTGNGSADGPFIYTGFRPKFILIKCSTNAYNWVMTDTSRDRYNTAEYGLYPNLSNAEGSGYPYMDILSNGFKQRYAGGGTNASGETFIYMAFAENPFKNSLAR
jgi:hypothetical protein